jgi:alanine racemase
MQLDMVRAGVSLYGLLPSADCDQSITTYPVMSWRTVVSMVKDLAPGQTVSYGRTFRSEGCMKVATISAGYADGYSRSYSNRGYVLIRGRKAPILGRVCMDQCVVDVTDIPGVAMGDTVTLAGTDGGETISFDDLAALSGTINYELVCLVGKRVDRIFLKDGRQIAAEGLI